MRTRECEAERTHRQLVNFSASVERLARVRLVAEVLVVLEGKHVRSLALYRMSCVRHRLLEGRPEEVVVRHLGRGERLELPARRSALLLLLYTDATLHELVPQEPADAAHSRAA